MPAAHKTTPHKRFSKMISLNAENVESAYLAEPHVAVMFSCRTLTRSAKVSCRTLQIAEPKAPNSEKLSGPISRDIAIL